MADHILIVDDSLTVRMDLSESFEAAGQPTRIAASASEARAAIAADLPALIVLDVVLPDGDGIDLLGELRRSPRTAAVPVVLLSGEAEVADRIRGLEHGADAYIGKPYDRDYLTSRVSELLRKDRADHERESVLIIDDSATYRDALGGMLRDAGYDVLAAASGEEGLRRASNERPDAIVVDGIMPGIDGAAVVRSIRLDPGLASTPCLMLTASDGALLEVEALDAGADAYARKTDAPDLVLARLAAVLRSARASRGRAAGSSLLGPKRILAVDDSPTWLEELSDNLRDEGYEVVKARSGEEALQLLALETFDCVLLDRVMPGLSGAETCRRIKDAPQLRRVPLIMLTAFDTPESMIEGVNAGADDYVAKSGDFEILRARLRAQLRRKQFEDEHRRVRDALMRKDAEAEAARHAAEAKKVLADALALKNEELARHSSELERLNKELETFAYSVSHDLRQPLRSMGGFSRVLLERYRDTIDEKGRHYLERISAGAQRMSDLIDGLLALSRITRAAITRRPVRLDEIARRILDRYVEGDPHRVVELHIHPDLEAEADPALVESVLENLIGNAWKFSARMPTARIEVGAVDDDGVRAFYVKDDGAGFDMAYSAKLFGPFQRLHAADEFEGTGIGLATVQRIVHRHGGRIWADSKPGAGATFYFTLEPAAGGRTHAHA